MVFFQNHSVDDMAQRKRRSALTPLGTQNLSLCDVYQIRKAAQERLDLFRLMSLSAVVSRPIPGISLYGGLGSPAAINRSNRNTIVDLNRTRPGRLPTRLPNRPQGLRNLAIVPVERRETFAPPRRRQEIEQGTETITPHIIMEKPGPDSLHLLGRKNTLLEPIPVADHLVKNLPEKGSTRNAINIATLAAVFLVSLQTAAGLGQVENSPVLRVAKGKEVADDGQRVLRLLAPTGVPMQT
jgi:hypothetical protein